MELKSLALLVCAAIPAVFVLTPDAHSLAGDVEPVDPIPMAPIAVYDVSGGTLLGQVAQSLVVYSNGRVQWSTASGEGNAGTATLSAVQLNGLIEELNSYSHLPDQTPFVYDIPVHTLTLLNGNYTTSRSWTLGGGAYNEVEDILERLVAFKFPAMQLPGKIE